jgi:hypothetical protein
MIIVDREDERWCHWWFWVRITIVASIGGCESGFGAVGQMSRHGGG